MRRSVNQSDLWGYHKRGKDELLLLVVVETVRGIGVCALWRVWVARVEAKISQQRDATHATYTTPFYTTKFLSFIVHLFLRLVSNYMPWHISHLINQSIYLCASIHHPHGQPVHHGGRAHQIR